MNFLNVNFLSKIIVIYWIKNDWKNYSYLFCLFCLFDWSITSKKHIISLNKKNSYDVVLNDNKNEGKYDDKKSLFCW
jgi:hypothetical protein